MTTICVDVMGADKEPAVLLEGVTQALEDDPELDRIGHLPGALHPRPPHPLA